MRQLAERFIIAVLIALFGAAIFGGYMLASWLGAL